MIGGVNDTELDANAMAELLRGDHAHVNLIPMNPVAHTPWTASPMPVIERFAATLRAAGIETTIRRNRGTRRSGRPAASSRRSGPGSRPRPSSRGGAPGWWPKARPPCSASAATSRRRPGWGTDRGRRTGPGRGEHPRCRPVEPGLRRPPGPGGRGGPHPPRRHGRALRPQPDVRGEDDQAPSQADRAAIRRPPDGRGAGPLPRRVPRRRLRLDHDPRRDRGGDRADAAARSGRPVARRAWRSSRARRCRRSSRTASCSTSSWS